MEKKIGQDKDREITYQLPSQEKQTQIWENKLILLPIKNRLEW